MKLYRLTLGFPVHPARSGAERCHAVDSCTAQGFWRNVGLISSDVVRNKRALRVFFSYASHERSSGRLASPISTRNSCRNCGRGKRNGDCVPNAPLFHDLSTRLPSRGPTRNTYRDYFNRKHEELE